MCSMIGLSIIGLMGHGGSLGVGITLCLLACCVAESVVVARMVGWLDGDIPSIWMGADHLWYLGREG